MSCGCDCNCDCGCDEVSYVQVPGPAGSDGAAGAAGAAGADGASPWTETTAQFVMPIVGGTVGVFVDSTAWMFIGQIVQVEGAGGMEVTAVNTGVSCTLENLGWSINAAPAAVIAASSMVVPSGPEGAAGTGGAPDDAFYWCSVADGDLSNEVDMSAFAAGYVKVDGAGNPTSVLIVPLADIDTGAGTTSQVLKPDGMGAATVGQVEDDEIEYQCNALVAGANVDIDWSLGRVFTMQLTVNTTFTFSNLVSGKSIMVILQQHAAAAKTVDFPGTVLWPAGAEAEISTTLSCKAVYSFVYDGTHVIGTVVNDCYT